VDEARNLAARITDADRSAHAWKHVANQTLAVDDLRTAFRAINGASPDERETLLHLIHSALSVCCRVGPMPGMKTVPTADEIRDLAAGIDDQGWRAEYLYICKGK
jgi:mono/diheme cytochrome c family protein